MEKIRRKIESTSIVEEVRFTGNKIVPYDSLEKAIDKARKLVGFLRNYYKDKEQEGEKIILDISHFYYYPILKDEYRFDEKLYDDKFVAFERLLEHLNKTKCFAPYRSSRSIGPPLGPIWSSEEITETSGIMLCVGIFNKGDLPQEKLELLLFPYSLNPFKELITNADKAIGTLCRKVDFYKLYCPLEKILGN